MKLETEKEIKSEDSEKMDIPNGIVSFLQKRNGIHQSKLGNHYSVTTLLACLRKSFYKASKIEGSELQENEQFDRLWSTTRGDLLHQITRAYNWRELDMNYDVILQDGRVATVGGRLDMYDWKTRTVIDLKTTKFVNWQLKRNFLPKQEHMMQIQIYGTMFSTLIPIENLCLVYADMDTMIAFKVKNVDMTNWINNRVQELEDSIIRMQPPRGEVSGLCQFCKYQTQCYHDGNGIQNLPRQHSENKNLNKEEKIYQ